jgi:anti-anti-sigma regulatory factor
MVFVLPHELTISGAATLRAALLAALDRGEDLALDGSAVTEADVAGLQLLCGAGRAARARGVRVALAPGACSVPLAEAIGLAGLGRDEADRWLVGPAAPPAPDRPAAEASRG